MRERESCYESQESAVGTSCYSVVVTTCIYISTYSPSFLGIITIHAYASCMY